MKQLLAIVLSLLIIISFNSQYIPFAKGDHSASNWRAASGDRVDRCTPYQEYIDSSEPSPASKSVYEQVSDTLVFVDAGNSVGSGIIFDACGHIVTNYHVIAQANYESIFVTLKDNRVYNAAVIGTDAYNDIAVLDIKDTSPWPRFTWSHINFPSMISNSDLSNSYSEEYGIYVGDTVYALGHPSIFKGSFTEGIISNVNQNVGLNTPVLVFDANIWHGSSGGALLDQYGRIIGITNWGDESRSQLNYAIPYNIVINSILNILANHYQIPKCSVAPTIVEQNEEGKNTNSIFTDQYCSLIPGGVWSQEFYDKYQKPNVIELVRGSEKTNNADPTATKSENEKITTTDPVCQIRNTLGIPC